VINRRTNFISQLEPSINRSELKQLKRVIKSSFVTEHELTKEFEHLIGQYTGANHAIAFCNGTMALYAGLVALGVGIGDEVIVPDLTFVATSNAVILCGAKPVFCDIDLTNFCLDADQLENLINHKTKVVIPVYLYGQSPDMRRIKEICKKHSIKIIEDAAQGIGVQVTIKNDDEVELRHAGTIGEIGILSFYGNKTITCGEGGIVLTNDPSIAESVYRLKNHGRIKKGSFIHEEIGFNFSFTEMQAAIGISQMDKLDSIQRKKLWIHNYYLSQLGNLNGIKVDIIKEQESPMYWITSIQVADPERLGEHLGKAGIGTRRFFYPLHMQPCYKFSNKVVIPKRDSWNSTLIYDKSLGLPSSVGIKKREIKYVCSTIKRYLAKK
jgi:perosamine synthetase